VTGSPPAKFERVGYYEAFNIDRSCNTMRVGSIPSEYTIVHWAFADLTRNYDIRVSPYEKDWAAFTQATGYKKVVSFGGWAFSTQATTYDIFRKGVGADQRETFSDKIVKFISANNLDGVDFDWEVWKRNSPKVDITLTELHSIPAHRTTKEKDFPWLDLRMRKTTWNFFVSSEKNFRAERHCLSLRQPRFGT
jgi:hypothetical protein